MPCHAWCVCVCACVCVYVYECVRACACVCVCVQQSALTTLNTHRHTRACVWSVQIPARQQQNRMQSPMWLVIIVSQQDALHRLGSSAVKHASAHFRGSGEVKGFMCIPCADRDQQKYWRVACVYACNRVQFRG